MNAPRNRAGREVSWQAAAPSGNPAEDYERYFVPAIGAPLAAELIETAKLRPGERVLDVACGTGIVTRLAAERVGPTGGLAGLDVNPGMLEVARSVAPREPQVEWHEASAEFMPLPDASFDVVLCQLSLQFVADKPAAVKEMRRVLASGGRLALNVPGPMPALFEAAHPVLARHLGPEAAGFVDRVFSLHDPEEMHGLLRDGGFRDVEVRQASKVLRLPPPREFLWRYLSSTPLAAPAAQLTAETRAALEQEVVDKWRDFAEEDGMRFEHRHLLATARR